uniref:Uncharacterized protein n=1 Tax=Setaria digitata TaxID=48799 RepID=A0A915PTY4_9BILA
MKNESSIMNKHSSNSIEKLSLEIPNAHCNILEQNEEIQEQNQPSNSFEGDVQMTGLCTNDISDADNQSRLSFIMKEKLHALAGNIRRRTSQA